jgi:hypothetical protein
MMKQRTFPKPEAIESAHLGSTPTLDELELVALYAESPASLWASRVVSNEHQALLASLGDDPISGVLAAGTDDTIVALTQGGLVWDGEDWVDDPSVWGATIELNEADSAFVARAFSEDCDAVEIRPTLPIAWITDSPLTAAGSSETPEKSRVVAIVDRLDKNAVLDLIAIQAGPKIFRRHAGVWEPDDGMLIALRSLDPPPLVKLEPNQIEGVVAQIDESTQGEDFEPTGEQPVRGSALEQRVAELELEALIAVAKSPKGIKGTEKLKRYWTTGEGGIRKIRWGTPGSWTRCYRHLRKYLGPGRRSKGYCMNLCQRMGGSGVACHVGSKGRRGSLVAASYRPVRTKFKRYDSSLFRRKTEAEKEGKKRKPTGGSRTPYARRERKTDRRLSDAEIEQRREAARRSAMARRKFQSGERAERVRSMSLSEKIELAVQLEAEGVAAKRRLESAIRAEDDPLRKAELRGELDDVKSMLASKDRWLRNEKAREIGQVDEAITKLRDETQRYEEAYARQLDSMWTEQEGLYRQIGSAGSLAERVSLQNQAMTNQRKIAEETQKHLRNREALSQRLDEYRQKRAALLEQYRKAAERLRQGRERAKAHIGGDFLL